MNIEPTVARVVLFSPAIDDSELLRAYAPFAAIIAGVNEDGTINVLAIGRHGSTHARGNVVMIQDAMVADPEAAFAMWMDYQRGQAAKSDELLEEMRDRFEKLQARVVMLEATQTQRSTVVSSAPYTPPSPIVVVPAPTVVVPD